MDPYGNQGTNIVEDPGHAQIRNLLNKLLKEGPSAFLEELGKIFGGVVADTPNDEAIKKANDALKSAEEVTKSKAKNCPPGTRQGDLPGKAKPNSTDVKDKGGGEGQIRDYGPDGRAKVDYDFGHDHGAGDPHAHDWNWSKKPPRQPGRSLKPGE